YPPRYFNAEPATYSDHVPSKVSSAPDAALTAQASGEVDGAAGAVWREGAGARGWRGPTSRGRFRDCCAAFLSGWSAGFTEGVPQAPTACSWMTVWALAIA